MELFVSLLRVIHITSVILMAWPFYALVAVNQRARLGPPLGDRVDTYLENIIKNRTISCYVFQLSALLSGVLIVLLRGLSLSYIVANPILAAKLALLLVVAALLTYVHTTLQPKIDSAFHELASPAASPELAGRIGSLRLRRKRMASMCLFCVLTAAMLGLQVWAAFPVWLIAVLVFAIAAFVWRAYSTVTAYGWV
jgi:hypothetical protein